MFVNFDNLFVSNTQFRFAVYVVYEEMMTLTIFKWKFTQL